MADLEFFTPSVRFKADGKTYTGVMDIDAFGELQKIWGVTTIDDMQKRLGAIGFPEMKDVVFVSLLRHQPTIKRAESDKVANAMGMHGIVKYVGDVVKAASPPASAVQRGPIKPARSRNKNRR